MATKTLADINVSGKRVFTRVDFNVPLDGSTITDDRRIVMALDSIKKVIADGGRLILASHLGRPKGEPKPEFSLKPCADRLGELIGKTVQLGPASVVDDSVRETVAGMADGDVLLLENVRYDAREDSKDLDQVTEFGNELATLADVYVNDAFGTCHRKHASMWAVPNAVKAAGGPAVAGYLVEKEIKYLHEAVAEPKRPFVAILGGAKVSDKIKLIDSLLGKCDKILIGGAMAYTLLKAKGVAVGSSRVEEDQVETMKDLLARAGDKIALPCDHVCAAEFASDDAQQVDDVNIPDGLMGLDIGPKSIAEFSSIIAGAGTVVWNGPMGVFEREAYATGTKAVAQAVADSSAVSVIGGGDSASAVEKFGLADQMTHVSTGGGASLTYLEGKPMPPIEVLDQK